MATGKPPSSYRGLADFGGSSMENGQQAQLLYQHGFNLKQTLLNTSYH